MNYLIAILSSYLWKDERVRYIQLQGQPLSILWEIPNSFQIPRLRRGSHASTSIGIYYWINYTF